ncbi:MAG: hypothetical protein A2Y77_16130 [Planctomycetes bacterium RBG_13_62_9]|nr:MAG: hypothetical protein A2Y77_16130 [Planctomycetes bacterium RBG_13_62_9]
MTETHLLQTEPVLDLEAARAPGVFEALRRIRPGTKDDLRNYVKVFLGITVPDKRLCPGHSSPMDYLWHTFSADAAPGRAAANADAVVWANRGGGKTQLAAVATLLDCLFKPHCQIRILGGSGEQSGRMYRYLTRFLQNGFEGFLAGPIRKGRCQFANGSAVEVLTQSATSVRGQHVQKLRCDEVELFQDEVFAAAKFTTQSTENVTAAMELISTMHRPYGIMQREVSAAAGSGVPLFKWCLWETIERCIGRTCSQCPLSDDCRDRAKAAYGYLKIDDCIAQMRRSSRVGWEAEMLCIKPSLENVVFGEFDPAVHVRPVDYDPNLPLYRSLDFGFINPFVCLWIQVDHDGVVRVIDEYVRSRATIDAHAEQIKTRTPCPQEQVTATFCDPAGAGSNDITGTSVVRELRALGIPARYRRSSILEGVELIRRAIRSGDGTSSLAISPHCPRLIEALQCYHYPDSGRIRTPGELPFKDGLYDHPIDALRYFFVNHKSRGVTTTRRY